ncbi:MAG: DUF3078 domain-containing protein [Balneolaceae bacterium]
MNKLLFLSALFFAATLNTQAQDTPVIPDTLSGWGVIWEAELNGSQASYSNWAQGGVNNIAATGNSNFTALYQQGRYSYAFTFNSRYGKSKVQDEGVRKTADRLSIRNRLLYDLSDDNGDFKLFGNINLRTQFDEGFDYNAGPDGEDILISRFMAPGYISENAGLAYIPSDFFSFEAGLGMQQTIVRDESLSETYGLDPGDTFRNEAGFTFAAIYEQRVAENLKLSSGVETFTNLNRPVSRTDFYFANELTGRINRLMSASLRFDLAYDDDFSSEIQVAQILSLGISFILL